MQADGHTRGRAEVGGCDGPFIRPEVFTGDEDLCDRRRRSLDEDLSLSLLLSNTFELRMIMSLACTNWLVLNFGARNDLISVFHQTLTLAKGWAAPH